jgi:hypothetical protein
MDYNNFLEQKQQIGGNHGFEPLFMPDFLFDFQKALIQWSCVKGRSAIFADCGLGKTAMQLVWAQNVVQKTNGRVLILTPLAVGGQTVREAHKFNIEAAQCRDGHLPKEKIVITNYQQLHKFNSNDFQGVVCDESSILKNFNGSTKQEITDFMHRVSYRLLCTATAAPNDFMELGTSSEALGEMKYKEMLAMFFVHDGGETSKWRLKKHAESSVFWRWMANWARAIRKPSDLGFDNNDFNLPELIIKQHIVKSKLPNDDFLFDMPAVTLDEQRHERKRTLNERCEMVADLVNHTNKPFISWCHLNVEGDLLEKLIPDAVQVSGNDTDEQKEKAFEDFESGKIRGIISKPVIAGLGLNWQHCDHQTFFPSHSFEQYYQAVRRSWRFGQKNNVTVDIVTSEGEMSVMQNLDRKKKQAEVLFQNLVAHMGEYYQDKKQTKQTKQMEIPVWI